MKMTTELFKLVNNTSENAINWILNNYSDDKIPTLQEVKMNDTELIITLKQGKKKITIEKRLDGKFKSITIEKNDKLVFYKDNGIYKI